MRFLSPFGLSAQTAWALHFFPLFILNYFKYVFMRTLRLVDKKNEAKKNLEP